MFCGVATKVGWCGAVGAVMSPDAATFATLLKLFVAHCGGVAGTETVATSA